MQLKEGHEVDYLDMKGLAIRKVNTNRKARDIFEEILSEDILRADEIDIPNIIRKYKSLEQEIYNSLASGSAEFGTPGKANTAASYKMPFSQGPFRGAILWNKFFPDEELNFPARVILIKLDIKSIQEIYDKIPEGTDENIIKVFEEVFEDEDMLIGGMINTISLPEGTENIPEFLVPFIDIDTIVNNTIKPGLILLESLGVRLVTTNRGNYPTTVITL